ncbi:MAG: ComF family protein [Psychroflexus sp.]|nr:ComF family protein [Psychroflexus sp.]MDN6310591.1 ComF family protein [Psychroflexus sp.]
MINKFVNFLFPRICAGCDTQLIDAEEVVCTYCLHRLAVYPEELQASAFATTFYGRVNYEYVKTLFYFQRGTAAQQLIHNLKYRGQKYIGKFVGHWMANMILAQEKNPYQFDAVVPVPLHPQRMRKRGYNQIAGFGQIISEKLQLKYVDDVLFRRSKSASQVFKNRLARTEMIEGGFYLKNSDKLKGKHVILVDDLITTGSTIESCYLSLRKIEDLKLSILSICLAR